MKMKVKPPAELASLGWRLSALEAWASGLKHDASHEDDVVAVPAGLLGLLDRKRNRNSRRRRDKEVRL